MSEARDNAHSEWLNGSPEIVIEVKSPSNTKAELNDKAMTTLTGEGSSEFWIVDPKTGSITVHTREGMRVYHAGEFVPLALFEARLSVDELFDGCK